MLAAADTLADIPPGLRDPLLEAFNALVRNYRERRWEPSELNGGKLCEVVYSVLRGHIDGKWPSKPKKPQRFDQACRDLEQADSKTFSRSVRVHVPRTLIALYEVRNNRGVGHVGGDVDPNAMDAGLVVAIAKWLMAELVREFHAVSTDEATEVVETLTERTLPVIWDVGTTRRVLATGLTMKDKALLLLYSSSQPIHESDLVRALEHSNASVFRRDILVKVHKDRLWEYDRSTGLVTISPLGIQQVEANVPLTVLA